MSIVNDSGPADRRILFDSISAAHQHLVIFTGGDHLVFNGHARVGPRAADGERRRTQENIPRSKHPSMNVPAGAAGGGRYN